ncbi:S41 family peptidase [Bacteroidota bacterium]
MKIQNKGYRVFIPLMFSIMLVVGMFIGNILPKGINQNEKIYHDRDKLGAVIDYIENEYVDSISKEDLTEKTIPYLLRKLDPHSFYIPAQNLENINEPLRGNFDGIGVRFNMHNDTLLINEVVKNGPSEKVGLLAGDRIIKVNDTIIAGVNFIDDNIVKMLKGKGGTKVNVSIDRKGVEGLLDFKITRGKIPIYSVDVAYMIDEEIGYIKIINFSQSTYKEFKDALRQLKNEGLSKLILDMRDNPGGVMSGATLIADEFLERGKLIVYTEGKSRSRENSYATTRDLGRDIELVILIDEGSASASEIIAGAIQDNDRGAIMGRRSFGKGLVQEQTMFTDGSALRLTIARYYTPTGRCIQKSYENGTEDYRNDLMQRYMHGEMTESDSITFEDSLKFTTPGGKIVYGGGGIMPDIFVPIDTLGISRYFTKVRRMGYIFRFALSYSDNNRNILNKFKDYKEIEEYLENQNILEKFIEFASEKGIERDNEGIKESGFIIDTQIKAYIARNFFDNSGFYPIIRKIDKTLMEAIALYN